MTLDRATLPVTIDTPAIEAAPIVLAANTASTSTPRDTDQKTAKAQAEEVRKLVREIDAFEDGRTKAGNSTKAVFKSLQWTTIDGSESVAKAFRSLKDWHDKGNLTRDPELADHLRLARMITNEIDQANGKAPRFTEEAALVAQYSAGNVDADQPASEQVASQPKRDSTLTIAKRLDQNLGDFAKGDNFPVLDPNDAAAVAARRDIGIVSQAMVKLPLQKLSEHSEKGDMNASVQPIVGEAGDKLNPLFQNVRDAYAAVDEARGRFNDKNKEHSTALQARRDQIADVFERDEFAEIRQAVTYKKYDALKGKSAEEQKQALEKLLNDYIDTKYEKGESGIQALEKRINELGDSVGTDGKPVAGLISQADQKRIAAFNDSEAARKAAVEAPSKTKDEKAAKAELVKKANEALIVYNDAAQEVGELKAEHRLNSKQHAALIQQRDRFAGTVKAFNEALNEKLGFGAIDKADQDKGQAQKAIEAAQARYSDSLVALANGLGRPAIENGAPQLTNGELVFEKEGSYTGVVQKLNEVAQSELKEQGDGRLSHALRTARESGTVEILSKNAHRALYSPWSIKFREVYDRLDSELHNPETLSMLPSVLQDAINNRRALTKEELEQLKKDGSGIKGEDAVKIGALLDTMYTEYDFDGQQRNTKFQAMMAVYHTKFAREATRRTVKYIKKDRADEGIDGLVEGDLRQNWLDENRRTVKLSGIKREVTDFGPFKMEKYMNEATSEKKLSGVKLLAEYGVIATSQYGAIVDQGENLSGWQRAAHALQFVAELGVGFIPFGGSARTVVRGGRGGGTGPHPF